jgi:hypothetical protein
MATTMEIEREDLGVHSATYHRFMMGVKWFAIHFFALAAFLTLWFCTPAGFWAGLFTGIVIFAAGVYAMTHGMAHSSEQPDPDSLAGSH